jgi:chromosome segregation ATPase
VCPKDCFKPWRKRLCKLFLSSILSNALAQAEKNRKTLQMEVDDVAASAGRERTAALKVETKRRQLQERLQMLASQKADAERSEADGLRAIASLHEKLRELTAQLDVARSRSAGAERERTAAAARIDETLAVG